MAAGQLMRLSASVALGTWMALGWTPGASASSVPAAVYAPRPSVHAILEESVPASGDTLAAAPPRLTLRFSGSIEESGAMLHLLGPEGRAWMLEVGRDPGDARTLVADAPALLPGAYRVAWRVISADGHPIGGELVFYVRDATNEAADLGDPPASEGAAQGMHTGGDGAPHVAARQIVLRAATDLVLLPLAGLLLFAAWGRSSLTARTDRTVRVLSVAAPLLAMAYAWLWAGETLGDGTSRLAGLLSLTTGRALAAETVLAMLVPWALLLARRVGLAAVLALLAVGAGGLGGHPASYTPMLSLPASVAHVVAAAIWLGGLAFLVTERGSTSYAVAARRVSLAALASVGVVAASGILQTLAMVDSLEALVASGFGLTLLAKVGGFAGLIAFGAYHRLRLVPAVSSSAAASGAPTEAATRLTSSVRYELALAACVVVLAALLSHIPPVS